MSELYPESFRPADEIKAIYFDGEHQPALTSSTSPDQIDAVGTTTENWEVTDSTQSF